MAVNVNIQAKKNNVWKWVGIGCGGTLVLGIAAIAGLGLWAYNTAKNMTDPKAATKMASEILEYKLPGTPEGFMGLDLMGMKFAGVMGNTDDEFAMLGLAKISGEMASADDQQKFERKLSEGMGSQFVSTDKRQESMQLCGQTVNVNVVSGTFKAETGDMPAVMYHTSVKHNNNFILVTLMGGGANPEATTDKVFETLKCK
jgi:hypothetical protein